MNIAVELDPVILKALSVFRSTDVESTANLKQMLNNAIATRKSNEQNDPSLPKSGLRPVPKQYIKTVNTSDQKKEKEHVQKRQFDKVQKDLVQFNNETAKRSHVEAVPPNGVLPFYSHGYNRSKVGKPPIVNLTPSSQSSGDFDQGVSAEEFEIEMEGLTCECCKQMTVGSGNQLVECQECHNLYHQECHSPAVSDAEISDPRCIWYCSRCKRNMKKQTKLLAKPVKTPVINLVSSSSDSDKASNGDSKNKLPVTPFKRAELKASLSSSGSASSGGSLSGWAHLSGGKPAPSSKPHDATGAGKYNGDHVVNHKPAAREKNAAKSAKDGGGKAPSPKYFRSDTAWAEALKGGGPSALPTSSSAKPRASQKSSSPSAQHGGASAPAGGVKQIQLSSEPWLSASGTNIRPKSATAKSSSCSASAQQKPAFAKTPGVASLHGAARGASMTPQDAAAKRLQMVKKKTAAKLQQKRTRV